MKTRSNFDETAQAIEEAENGHTIKCRDFCEYLKLVSNISELPIFYCEQAYPAHLDF